MDQTEVFPDRAPEVELTQQQKYEAAKKLKREALQAKAAKVDEQFKLIKERAAALAATPERQAVLAKRKARKQIRRRKS